MARFIELLSADEKEHYIANIDAIAVIRITKGVSPENTIVFIGGEKVKAQILGDKAKVYYGPVLRHPAELLPAVDLGGRVWLGGRSCKGWPAAPAFGG
jgi:hypothetical protein